MAVSGATSSSDPFFALRQHRAKANNSAIQKYDPRQKKRTRGNLSDHWGSRSASSFQQKAQKLKRTSPTTVCPLVVRALNSKHSYPVFQRFSPPHNASKWVDFLFPFRLQSVVHYSFPLHAFVCAQIKREREKKTVPARDCQGYLFSVDPLRRDDSLPAVV